MPQLGSKDPPVLEALRSRGYLDQKKRMIQVVGKMFMFFCFCLYRSPKNLKQIMLSWGAKRCRLISDSLVIVFFFLAVDSVDIPKIIQPLLVSTIYPPQSLTYRHSPWKVTFPTVVFQAWFFSGCPASDFWRRWVLEKPAKVGFYTRGMATRGS